MKILRISLRNIASLAGDHTVDFTKPPLVNAGLFSISGPTGSGKSTLLDALCLALFDETPRLAVVSGAAAVTDAGQAVQQNDARNLLRRGCGEGYAEVAFLGVDGFAYTASWVARRARQKASGAFQQTQMNLFQGNVLHGTERQVAFSGTRTQVLKEIEAKVGLNFDQFRRAVLLAQGDFANFLKAKDNERAEILQALTGTERFEKISKAVYERHKREEAVVAQMRTQIGTLLPLSPEERAQADEAWREATQAKVRLEQQCSARNKQLEWFVLLQQHEASVQEAFAQVQGLERLVEEDKPRAQRMQWIRTASLEAGPLFTREKTAGGLLATGLERVKTLEAQRTGLEGTAKTAKDAHSSRVEAHRKIEERKRGLAGDIAKARVLDGELTQIEGSVSLAHTEQQRAGKAASNAAEALATLETVLVESEEIRTGLNQRISAVDCFAPFAAELDGWLERFGAEKKTREKRGGLEKKLKIATAAEAAAAKQLAQAAALLPGLQQELASCEAQWRAAAQNAAAFDSTDILTRRRGALELREALQELRSQLETRKRCEEEQHACSQAIEALEQQIAAERLKSSALREEQLPLAQRALSQARDSLGIAEAAASEQALVLRQALRPGEACPVCGALEHPNADVQHSPQEAVFKALRWDVEAKEKNLGRIQTDLARTDAFIEQFGKQRQELRGSLEKIGQRMKALNVYCPSLPEAVALWKQPEAQRETNLAKREDETVELLADLDRSDARRIDAEQKEKIAKEAVEEKSQKLRSAVSAQEQAGHAATVAQTDRVRIAEELALAESEHREALEKVSAVLEGLADAAGAGSRTEGAGAKPDYSNDPEGFLAWFQRGAREWGVATQLLAEAGRKEAAARGQLEPLRQAAETARKDFVGRSEAHEMAMQGFAAKKQERNGLLDGRAVAEVEAEISSQLEEAFAALEHAQKDSVAANDRLSANAQLLVAQHEQIAAQEKELREAGDALEHWLREFGRREARPTDRGDLEDWLGRDAQWLKREETELKEREKQLSSAKGGEAKMRTQLEEHLRTQTTDEHRETVAADAARLGQELGAAVELEDTRKLAVLADDQKRLQTGKLTEALRAQEKVWEPWQKLNALIGSADGTKFRTIAQQWTLEILLRHANAQLQILSGRYRLERLRDSLNLLVTDLEMDGQQRSVHSLSGGESFLVSLGLALGLASLTSSRLRIESLFIDEGFGSLDSETLRVALNALNNLEAQGRKVGVISHVSEMVDAIPAQVRVVRSQGGASRIVV